MTKWISPKKYNCNTCTELVPAYYIQSLHAKQLWVQCPHCGLHARPYIPNLNLPYKPSKRYVQETTHDALKEGFVPKKKSAYCACGNMNPRGGSECGACARKNLPEKQASINFAAPTEIKRQSPKPKISSEKSSDKKIKIPLKTGYLLMTEKQARELGLT